jgi:hypothetical protein
MKQVVMSILRMLLPSQQRRIYVLFVQEFAGCPEDHGDMGLLFRCNYIGKPVKIDVVLTQRLCGP